MRSAPVPTTCGAPDCGDNPSERPEYSQVWYRVDHTLVWLDLYLTGTEEGFAPPAPFTLVEMKEDDLPERPSTKDELQAYLEYGRRKCQATIEVLTDEAAQRRCRFAWGDVSCNELPTITTTVIEAAHEHLVIGAQ